VMAGAVTDIASARLSCAYRFARRSARFRLATVGLGTAFAHFGIGVTLMGIVGVTAWAASASPRSSPAPVSISRITGVTSDGTFNRAGSNYRDVVGASPFTG